MKSAAILVLTLLMIAACGPRSRSERVLDLPEPEPSPVQIIADAEDFDILNHRLLIENESSAEICAIEVRETDGTISAYAVNLLDRPIPAGDVGRVDVLRDQSPDVRYVVVVGGCDGAQVWRFEFNNLASSDVTTLTLDD